MSVFFNGRQLISPTTASAVDDSAMANRNLTVGNNLALVGKSADGKPNTALRFGSPDEAEAALVSGELLQAVLRAFDPSSETGAPAVITAVRVNPAVQATSDVKDGAAATVLTLKSTGYGLRNNQIRYKIEAGTTSGKRLTTQFGNDFYTGDNIGRNAFQIQYTGGQASAQMTVTQTQVILAAPTGTTLATIDLAVYKTVAELVDRINATAGFVASVQDGNDTKPTLNALDNLAATDVKTAPVIAKADLQAIIDWFNSNAEGYVDATRAAGAGTVPANVAFTYLSGGSDGTTTNQNWSDAYQTLQTVDAQWIVPVTSDPAIHAMNSSHTSFMSNVGKAERRGIVGTANGTTDAAAIAAAKALNDDRTSLVHMGFYDFDDNSVLTLYPPYLLAAQIGGAFAGVSPGTPLTNKSLKVRGLERDLRNPTDTDPLIQGGVLAVENTPTGYKVVQSISTWLINDNYNRVEVSTGAAVDFVSRSVRNAVDGLRGGKQNPISLGRAVSITDSTLRELARAEPQGPGVIVGDENSPAYRNITATMEGDVIRIQFECSPVIPTNYVLVTIYARPFSGTASA